jgi:hypothetical protein
VDFALIHLKIGSLAASTMAKLSHIVNTNKIEELVFNSHSEEQCTLSVPDMKHKTQ